MTTKTHNSYLADRVALRLGHLPDKPAVRVLDCFAGRGVIWRAVRELDGGKHKIKVLPIESHQEEDDLFALPGENSRFLETLDLSKFDVIDLDAFGIPFEQLQIIFRRKYQGWVFVTFVQTMFGIMPNRLLREVGFTREMVVKSPVLFTKRGWQYFLEYLAIKGVRQVNVRQHVNKHYLAFQITSAGGAGGGSGSRKAGTLANPS